MVLFDYKFICSKDSYRGKPTLFFVSRKDTLNPFTQKALKEIICPDFAPVSYENESPESNAHKIEGRNLGRD